MNAVIIDGARVRKLRLLSFRWHDVALLLNVNERTLWRWRERTAFVEPLLELDDAQLDVKVLALNDCNPARGQVTTSGALLALGFRVSRGSVRASLERVDPDGLEARRRRPVKRRVYNVTQPHHLWHQDGWHKLIRYGLVVHGCVDGGTRTIIYLACRDNNRSATVLGELMGAVARHQVPARMRGDRGGENILAAAFMLDHRGGGGYLTGSSKHNTRIERLWRDMRSRSMDYYIALFRRFEEEGMDITNALHIWVLQYMFLPRLNEDLQRFIQMWNLHSLSTENNRSPLQLLELRRGGAPAPVDIDYDTYGMDEERDYDEDDEVAAVQVDPLDCPLTEHERRLYAAHIRPLSLQDPLDTLFKKYIDALDLINYLWYR
mmetsp:Transcript_19384/g.43200  ORF Transcript_19384/g.43200 Transcript_19384/m.43200 type:complete len:377 (+) Transcript_19384:26-1156(+)